LKLPYPPIISILKGKNTESKIHDFAVKGSAELPELLRAARTGAATVPHVIFQISPADKKTAALNLPVWSYLAMGFGYLGAEIRSSRS
jgi:hypothetical protein